MEVFKTTKIFLLFKQLLPRLKYLSAIASKLRKKSNHKKQ